LRLAYRQFRKNGINAVFRFLLQPPAIVRASCLDQVRQTSARGAAVTGCELLPSKSCLSADAQEGQKKSEKTTRDFQIENASVAELYRWLIFG
jgi:hypothetical protein